MQRLLLLELISLFSPFLLLTYFNRFILLRSMIINNLLIMFLLLLLLTSLSCWSGLSIKWSSQSQILRRSISKYSNPFLRNLERHMLLHIRYLKHLLHFFLFLLLELLNLLWIFYVSLVSTLIKHFYLFEFRLENSSLNRVPFPSQLENFQNPNGFLSQVKHFRVWFHFIFNLSSQFHSIFLSLSKGWVVICVIIVSFFPKHSQERSFPLFSLIFPVL